MPLVAKTDLLKAVVFLFVCCSPLAASEQLELEVREAGGFRRNDPVSTLLTLPHAVERGTPFRLLLDGKPVVAQFRSNDETQQTTQWWVDFSATLAPHEVRTYVVEFGNDVVPVAESTKGHVLRETKDAFIIENAPYISWTVPRDLTGLLRTVDFPPNEHLRSGSPGLILKDQNGNRYALGGAGVKAKTVRSGTRAVALQFAGSFDSGPLADVSWKVDLVFPAPVSWVEVILSIDDPEGKVAALGTELNLALDPPKPDAPTLVDMGAWTQVYTSLSQNDIVELQATRAGQCSVLRGKAENLIPLAKNDASIDKPSLLAPEGWLHVMDRKRCLALAVDQFAQQAHERLTVTADGSVRVWREYAAPVEGSPKSPTKSLRCWWHFVHYPPQQSAATSPRMMQTPSIVRIKK